MGEGLVVDTTFDVRTDAAGMDPDRFSKTLRRYHQLLWSKPLPGGALFHLDAALQHTSVVGEFRLSSDTIAATYSRWLRPERLLDIVRQVPPPEVNAVCDLAATIGAYLVFPMPLRVENPRRQSINQQRGIHPRIRDRFDLTLECIRLHYRGESSPLEGVIGSHRDFFALFGDFRGYVDHFLLNDLVAADYSSVTFLAPFDSFAGDPLPAASLDEYRGYLARSTDFVAARNDRIRAYTVPQPHAEVSLAERPPYLPAEQPAPLSDGRA